MDNHQTDREAELSELMKVLFTPALFAFVFVC
jgi:hypothetical protein